MFSKKIILSILFFVILVGGVIGLKTLKNYNLSPFKNDNELLTVTPQNPELYKDADQDGLKDWEEDLWKTDINNPDTDSDGTNDFDEIRSGRNPVIAGPNDKLDTKDYKNKTNEILESDLTETDKFSRLFFAQYIASKKDGGNYKDGDYKKLVSFLNKPMTDSDLFKKTTSDFTAVPATNKNIKKYISELSKIIQDGQKKYPASELVELQKLEDGQENNFDTNNIKEAETRYKYIADELMKVDVPADLLLNHTKMVNVIYLLSESVSAMKSYLADPAGVATKISLYPDSLEILNNSINYLNDYLKEKKIKFSTSESGYIFFGKL